MQICICEIELFSFFAVKNSVNLTTVYLEVNTEGNNETQFSEQEVTRGCLKRRKDEMQKYTTEHTLSLHFHLMMDASRAETTGASSYIIAQPEVFKYCYKNKSITATL